MYCNIPLKDKYHLLAPSKLNNSLTSSAPSSSAASSPLKPLQNNRTNENGKVVFNAMFPELRPSLLQSNGVKDHVKVPQVGSGDGSKSNVAKPTGLASKNTTSSSDIPKPKYLIDSPNSLMLEWQNQRQIGPGLTNLGNTCFMNSVIQCLTYCPPLVNSLLKGDHATKCASTSSCMACLFKNHFREVMTNRNAGVLTPKIFASKLKMLSKNFSWGRQEDAHEYLRHVIDNMCRMAVLSAENEKNKSSFGSGFKFDPRSKETTIFNHIFGGYLRSQITCGNCKSTSNTFDHFMDLMLDIKNVSTLERALTKFTSCETLSYDNSYTCTNCKSKSEATKKFTIHTPPNVLTIQLKRFEYNRPFGKLTKRVDFDEEINLRRFMSDPASQSSNVTYKLFAVLVHLGNTCNSGHYYCFVRNSNDLWYQMDDASVSKTSLNFVLQQKAYILFYVRKKSTSKLHESYPVSVPNRVFNSTVINGSKAPLVNGHLSNGNLPKVIGQTSNKLIGPVVPLKKPMLSDPTASPVKKVTIAPFKSTASNIVVVKQNGGNRPAVISDKPSFKLNGDTSTTVKTSSFTQSSSNKVPSKVESNKRLVAYSDNESDNEENPVVKKKVKWDADQDVQEKPTNGIRIFSSSSNSVSSLSDHSSHSSRDNSPPTKEVESGNNIPSIQPPSTAEARPSTSVPVMNGSKTVITKEIIHKPSDFEADVNSSLLSYGSIGKQFFYCEIDRFFRLKNFSICSKIVEW